MNDLSNVSPMVALAELMLESDEVRAKADDDALRTAQQERRQALDDEAHALHDAADHTRVGAWVEGLTTAAGGAASAFGSGLTPVGKEPAGGAGVLFHSGQALEHMAGPGGRLLGEAPSQDDQANAKQAEARAGDAGTRADSAKQHHDRLRDAQDRTLATVESIVESEAQGNWALIANV